MTQAISSYCLVGRPPRSPIFYLIQVVRTPQSAVLPLPSPLFSNLHHLRSSFSLVLLLLWTPGLFPLCTPSLTISLSLFLTFELIASTPTLPRKAHGLSFSQAQPSGSISKEDF